MRVVDLFAGIGGFSLGLERAGLRTVAFCEIDERKRAVLATHWPHVPCFADVRTLRGAQIAERPVDVVCAGFPCQDLSQVGRRAGLAGEHSGLWTHCARIVRELRPKFVIVENVPGLLVRGLDTVLADLAASGFDAEWDCIPAAAVGAPQLRARIWLLAYRRGVREEAHDTVFAGRPELDLFARWIPEPELPRVDHGLPGFVAECYGAALVPQIAEFIGRRLMLCAWQPSSSLQS